jgi:AcrR family transcriptional regulator
MPLKSFSRAAERRSERRQQILDTASELFSEHGYENVTLRAIAEKLGYAHAALYRYFPDKASLLAEICRETFDQLIVELDMREAKARSPQARLFAVSLGFVRFGLAHPHHFRVLFSSPENRNGLGGSQHIDAIGRPLFDRLMQAFVACSEAEGLSKKNRILDAQTWWISIFGTTHILVTSCAVIMPASSDEIIRRHIEVMWKGFQAASRPASSGKFGNVVTRN